MVATKFKRTELPKIRKLLIAKQLGVCPICKKDLTRVAPTNVVIDHNHTTGFVRAAMHRGCNGVEGKVLKLLTTWGKAIGMTQVIKTLENLIEFWKLHKTDQTGLIYYSHKTPTEKRLALNKRRRRRSLAKKKREELS